MIKRFYLGIILMASCASPPEMKTPTRQVPPDFDTVEANADNASGGLDAPNFGLMKIKAMIDTIRVRDDTAMMDVDVAVLNARVYAGLTLDEKFAYNLLHPEWYGQTCDALPDHKDLEHRIFAMLPHPSDTVNIVFSERQNDFFDHNRDSVIVLLQQVITRQNEVTTDVKSVIYEINATELIPTLIYTYHQKQPPRDHYILTLLMMLMEKNEYPGFMQSISHKKLYGSDANKYAAYLVYNQANEDLIFQRAMNFYNGLPKK
ncbi:hypothetical protein [Dinghuibacter silviterrae]|uniref:Uncharacterized protein n=1 Tax=Dinghuibacter silviterrae TaxID=1539049 RepID=A0A4R8DUJ1_9BACT|nr:hypothetical protein [Dinghuibacter silviterrae]TDX02052.1 hypothetical protein EDB95_3101 [Dinghuibacter silviterrae]